MKILDVVCSDCAAPPGSRCVTQEGGARVRFHQSRVSSAGLANGKYRAYDEQLNLSLAERPSVLCGYCGAKSGDPCLRSEGEIRVRPHAARKQSSSSPLTSHAGAGMVET